MPASSRARMILIVVGSSLRAEEADRPLAYYLKRQIEAAVGGLAPPTGDAEKPSVTVVADLRWLHDEVLQPWPTISLGGPGVNFLSQRWVEELPLSLAVDNQYYVQMDPDLTEPRVSLWGMDNSTTQIAVSAFLQRFLPRFLERCLSMDPDEEPIELEGEDDEDEDEDES